MGSEAHNRPAALNFEQAARYLGVSAATLRSLARRGELRPAIVGGRKVVRLRELDALLDERAAA